MGKNKLARWAELDTFNNVIQPDHQSVRSDNHPLKGNWKIGYFRNNNPLVLELGCGKGEYTVELARTFPEKNFVGIDIKGARIWRGAKTAYEDRIPNVLFLRTRIEFISSFFADNEADEIWLTFPDPFPRIRDENRRLTSPPFLNQYRTFLSDKGIIHLKTDNNQLYQYTLSMAIRNKLEIVTATEDLYNSEIQDKILAIKTHYENIFLSEGKNIHYLSFRLEQNKELYDANQEKEF